MCENSNLNVITLMVGVGGISLLYFIWDLWRKSSQFYGHKLRGGGLQNGKIAGSKLFAPPPFKTG